MKREGVHRNPYRTTRCSKRGSRLKPEELKNGVEDRAGNEFWRVIIYCDMETLKKDLTEESGKTGGVELGKEQSIDIDESSIDAVIRKKVDEYCHLCFKEFREQSRVMRVNKLVDKDTSEANERQVLNIDVLVDRNRERDFIDVVEFLRTQFSDKGFIINYKGPLPSVSFGKPNSNDFMDNVKS
jgi:hypothetical protein